VTGRSLAQYRITASIGGAGGIPACADEDERAGLCRFETPLQVTRNRDDR